MENKKSNEGYSSPEIIERGEDERFIYFTNADGSKHYVDKEKLITIDGKILEKGSQHPPLSD